MLTKSTVQEIQADLSAALKAVAEKHNLSMSGTKISYTSTDFKLTCSFGDKTATGGVEVDPVLFRNLQRNGFMHGLDTTMINREISTPQGVGTMQGLRGAKAVIKIKSTGKSYLFPAAWVAREMNK